MTGESIPLMLCISEGRPTSSRSRLSAAKGGACLLTLALYWEAFSDAQAATYFFPINTLRNYAALMVRACHYSLLKLSPCSFIG